MPYGSCTWLWIPHSPRWVSLICPDKAAEEAQAVQAHPKRKWTVNVHLTTVSQSATKHTDVLQLHCEMEPDWLCSAPLPLSPDLPSPLTSATWGWETAAFIDFIRSYVFSVRLGPGPSFILLLKIFCGQGFTRLPKVSQNSNDKCMQPESISLVCVPLPNHTPTGMSTGQGGKVAAPCHMRTLIHHDNHCSLWRAFYSRIFKRLFCWFKWWPCSVRYLIPVTMVSHFNFHTDRMRLIRTSCFTGRRIQDFGISSLEEAVDYISI